MKETTPAFLAAALVQHPGIACGTVRMSYHSSVSAALMDPSLIRALNFLRG